MAAPLSSIIVLLERTLKIYRASAGSGKTFTLALEYIKLVVENPYCYRNILAVTFTNKATGEMKERILSKLYGVANRSDSAKDYLEKVKEQLPHMSEEKIIANAGKAMELLLHDYGHFRIQTIDAFFQTVLRSLAKELDLNGDIEITLDSKELLSEAVDTYIKKLEPGTLNIAQVVRYIEDRLSNGEQWRVSNDIKEFAENILKEEYQQRGEKLREEMEENNGERLKQFYEDVTAHRRNIIQQAKSIGETFFNLAQGLTCDDFHGKKNGIWGLFEKLRNGIVPEWTPTRSALAEKPDKISSKCGSVQQIAALIRDAVPLYMEFQNCELALEHYHQLGMLNNIAATLKEENYRENRFLLAETTHLLSSMIEKNTTFIFEKIGTEIDHIFIDEFQDTSQLQWTCFHVLLEEILARGNFNLIVGDVKQSIYRWRNSDWNIMNRIGDHFRGDQITFAEQDVKAEGQIFKSTNYRSDCRIIKFNNMLYRAAIGSVKSSYSGMIDPQGMQEIELAYSDVEQAMPSPKAGKNEKPLQGYAEVRMIKKDEETNFAGKAIAQLMDTLEMLLKEKNIAPGDIAILMRYKNKMQDVVEAFNSRFPGLKIVSDEAYRLSSSLTIQLVISSLRYIAEPKDRINIANLVKLYNTVVCSQEFSLAASPSDGELLLMLPQEFRDALAGIARLPLYELIEQILALPGIDGAKEEEAYIYAFLDHASQYINSRSADINKFLKAWDESIHEKSIPAESIDSVRIMTVHKSKGLEFHTVIVPMCDWTLTGDSRSLLWCKTRTKPFDKLSLLPISGKKEVRNSIFSKEYCNEYKYQVVDNLNILYVATTRAKSNLIIFTDGSGGRGENVSKLMNTIMETFTGPNGEVLDKETGIFTYGEIVSSKADADARNEGRKGDNPFESEPSVARQPFTYFESRIEFRQSNDLERFLADDEEERKQYDYIEEGKLMHLVMSGIKTRDDITRTLDRLTIEGLIPTEDKYNRIKSLVEKAVSQPMAAEWFNGSYRLYNECSILGDNDSKLRRPDRVMIKDDTAVVVDYKFGRENDDYKEQVKRYMNLLKEIGYANVKGFLWYVYKNSIKEV